MQINNHQLRGKIIWYYNNVVKVTLFNGISTLFRLFNAKSILLEEQQRYYLTHTWEDKGVHTFPKSICPKVNIIERLEYVLAYYDSAVHCLNHYTTRTPPVVKLLPLNKASWKHIIRKNLPSCRWLTKTTMDGITERVKEVHAVGKPYKDDDDFKNYLTPRWDHNKYYQSGSNGNESINLDSQDLQDWSLTN